jgi:hypothetical protein
VRIISTYPGVELEEMGVFRDRYFSKVERLEDVVIEAIASSPECLNHVTAEEDLEHNGPLYLEVLIAWQVAILRWEMAWRYYHRHAGVEIATVAEIQRMFFGESGISAMLDQIGYKFTDTQRAVMAEVLEDVRNQDEGE